MSVQRSLLFQCSTFLVGIASFACSLVGLTRLAFADGENYSSISLIEAGTTIAETAPAGWTHLLFKNSSSIGAGDLEAATANLKHLASFLSSAMVAKVQRATEGDSGSPFVLSDVGYGLCTPIQQKDVVITSATREKLGARMGLIDSLALSKSEARIKQMKVASKTSGMWIVDAPTMVLFEGKHLEAQVRHVILVEPTSGEVGTMIWFLNPSASANRVISDIDWVPVNSNIKVVLHLDKSHFTLGLVSEKALALNQMMYSAKQLKMPPALEPIAKLPSLTGQHVLDLEAGLRTFFR